MKNLFLILSLIIFPMEVKGVEFFSHAVGNYGLAWLEEDIFSDSLYTDSSLIFSFRGYSNSFIKEGGFQGFLQKEKASFGLDCSFQFHDLMSTQVFDFRFYRTFTTLISGDFSFDWTRVAPSDFTAVHEFSFSWRLKMYPTRRVKTSIGFDKHPFLSQPKGSPALNTPAWFGTFSYQMIPTVHVLTGVYCRQGFNPDWAIGTSIKGGRYTVWHAAWFSLSHATHMSFSLMYHSWKFQWIVRWHPYLGLCSGSSVSWDF
ncbi:MAG: hypothetical protein PHE86_00065 [Candidatus Marinimicrobia bacterium]|nr:hypothetical protein [Candidatus Neomarinimicrobiota bacterium]